MRISVETSRGMRLLREAVELNERVRKLAESLEYPCLETDDGEGELQALFDDYTGYIDRLIIESLHRDNEIKPRGNQEKRMKGRHKKGKNRKK